MRNGVTLRDRLALAWAIVRGAEVVFDATENEMRKWDDDERRQREHDTPESRYWYLEKMLRVWVPRRSPRSGGAEWLGILPVGSRDWRDRVTVIRWR